MKDKELSMSMANSIDTDSIVEFASDIGEIILDNTILDNNDKLNILSEIPIFGSLFKLTKAGVSINNYIYTKKIYSFLQELSKVPESKRKKFIKNLADEKEQIKIGEKLLILIDKLDEIEKSTLLAKTFGALIQEKITRKEFNIISHAILQLNTEYIYELVFFYLFNNKNIIPSAVDHLYNCGFISLAGKNARIPMGGYSKNNIGDKFVNEILNLDKLEIIKAVLKIVEDSQICEQSNPSEEDIIQIMDMDEVETLLSQFDLNCILKFIVVHNHIYVESKPWIIRYIGSNKYEYIKKANTH